MHRVTVKSACSLELYNLLMLVLSLSGDHRNSSDGRLTVGSMVLAPDPGFGPTGYHHLICKIER